MAKAHEWLGGKPGKRQLTMLGVLADALVELVRLKDAGMPVLTVRRPFAPLELVRFHLGHERVLFLVLFTRGESHGFPDPVQVHGL